MNLGSLTLEAAAGPVGDVCIDTGPYKFCGDGLASPSDPWVAQAVDNVENSFAPGLGDKWPGWAVPDINDDVPGSNVDPFEV